MKRDSMLSTVGHLAENDSNCHCGSDMSMCDRTVSRDVAAGDVNSQITLPVGLIAVVSRAGTPGSMDSVGRVRSNLRIACRCGPSTGAQGLRWVDAGGPAGGHPGTRESDQGYER